MTVLQLIALASNREKVFNHGWFAVRNRTPSEVEREAGANESFQSEQTFFNAEPWRTWRQSLEKDRCGINALKNFLAGLLCERIKGTFPTFLEEIARLQAAINLELGPLGRARTTVEEKRSYLTGIAVGFQDLAWQGIRGRYDSLSANDMKLRMRIREANDEFALSMQISGHSVSFEEQIDVAVQRKQPRWWPDPASSLQSGERANASPNCFENSTTNQPSTNSGGIFPNLSTFNKVGEIAPTTLFMLFQPCKMQGAPMSTDVFQSINFVKPYLQHSFEELRLSDYTQAPSTASKPSSGTIFGKSGQCTVSPPNVMSGQTLGSTGTSTQTNPKSATRLFDLPSTQPKQTFGSANLFSNDSSQWTQPPRLGNTFIQSTPKDKDTSAIYKWIRDQIKICKGTELQGTLNPDLLPILFHKQAVKWRWLAEIHFVAIEKLIFDGLVQNLASVSPDPLTRVSIEALIRTINEESKKRALASLTRRSDEILIRHLQTSNPAFERRVGEARKKRFLAALERYRISKDPWSSQQTSSSGTTIDGNRQRDENQIVIDMRNVDSLFAELNISNSQNLENEIHDTLKAYYEMARENFITFMTMSSKATFAILKDRYFSSIQSMWLVLSLRRSTLWG